ncbi:MAG: maleylpyruvate isomerase family mycothiol-dependent enzyme [Microthrixaceae bacterium]
MTAPHRPLTRDALLVDLRDVWTETEDLLASLDDEDWQAPSPCPGWTVQDVVAHVVGTEWMLEGRAAPAVEVPDAPHLRNDIGRMNEAWIIERRPWPPAEVLTEFRDMVAVRTAAVAALTDDQVAAESWTPAGMATLGRFLQIRVFDTWIHEQDIREALGRGGHESGPAVERALAEVAAGLPFVVGKKAAAPDGAWVRVELPGPEPAVLDVVVDGRAALVDAPPAGEPTVTLRTDSSAFVRLVGGRWAPDDPRVAERVVLSGDAELGDRLLRGLAYVI